MLPIVSFSYLHLHQHALSHWVYLHCKRKVQFNFISPICSALDGIYAEAGAEGRDPDRTGQDRTEVGGGWLVEFGFSNMEVCGEMQLWIVCMCLCTIRRKLCNMNVLFTFSSSSSYFSFNKFWFIIPLASVNSDIL